MNTWFNTLFTLRVAHEYYGTSEICPDFDFVLAEHSQRALAGAKLLTRTSGGKLYVLFEADKKEAPLPKDLAGLELLVGLRLRNPYFEYFTEPAPAPFPLYTNSASPNALDDEPQTSDLVARRFAPVTSIEGRPLTLEIKRLRDKSLILSKEIQKGDDMPVLDTHAWENGCYRVTLKAAGKIETRGLIVAPDLAAKDIWGAVNILVTDDLGKTPNGEPTPSREFQVTFKACKENLDYYIVAHNWSVDDFNLISVTDASKTVEFERINRDKSVELLISPRLLGTSGDQIALFRSASKVLRRDVPMQHFQLWHKNVTLIDYLPLPRADMPLARFVVHLSKT